VFVPLALLAATAAAFLALRRRTHAASPGPLRLLDRLLADLAGDDPARLERAQALLAQYPGDVLVPLLLPLLGRGPLDAGAAAAARILLLQADERVVEPLHGFFARQEGALEALLDDLAGGPANVLPFSAPRQRRPRRAARYTA
jgi:hypothetical protein